ncbi:MAG TPA: 23S rRNA pseudouridine synthase F [Candidatus Yanofskybacteria bacterium]|nr:23S rRNA pseudouridine synthase F [Candidatus Yanofskybacteria bacterium]HBT80545.1 23S rRNA pseudouridine synthase F [Candidatus Yanofskybacteria bacterium]HBX58529.1 23S rRNA pseudouridine synthase F [Candidatus Yanofskybacteria bacterium]
MRPLFSYPILWHTSPMNKPKENKFPMRINKYLAHKGYSTRLGGDELVRNKMVKINGKVAELGSKVEEKDKVEIIGGDKERKYKYFAYNKPIGQTTEDIVFTEGFPLGRLDKSSHGLILVTDDGRVTDRLLNPDYSHEKEYITYTHDKLPSNFKKRMELGINIEGYITKPCRIDVLGENKFRIVLIEGKKHQIRRMCAALGLRIRDLKRTRIMNIMLGELPDGHKRQIDGKELKDFLGGIGL